MKRKFIQSSTNMKVTWGILLFVLTAIEAKVHIREDELEKIETSLHRCLNSVFILNNILRSYKNNNSTSEFLKFLDSNESSNQGYDSLVEETTITFLKSKQPDRSTMSSKAFSQASSFSTTNSVPNNVTSSATTQRNQINTSTLSQDSYNDQTAIGVTDSSELDFPTSDQDNLTQRTNNLQDEEKSGDISNSTGKSIGTNEDDESSRSTPYTDATPIDFVHEITNVISNDGNVDNPKEIYQQDPEYDSSSTRLKENSEEIESNDPNTTGPVIDTTSPMNDNVPSKISDNALLSANASESNSSAAFLDSSNDSLTTSYTEYSTSIPSLIFDNLVGNEISFTESEEGTNSSNEFAWYDNSTKVKRDSFEETWCLQTQKVLGNLTEQLQHMNEGYLDGTLIFEFAKEVEDLEVFVEEAQRSMFVYNTCEDIFEMEELYKNVTRLTRSQLRHVGYLLLLRRGPLLVSIVAYVVLMVVCSLLFLLIICLVQKPCKLWRKKRSIDITKRGTNGHAEVYEMSNSCYRYTNHNRNSARH